MADKLEEYVRQNLDRIMNSFPVEERLKGISPEKRLEGLSSEKRLEGIPAEDRLKGLSPEERLEGLSPEEQRLMLEELKRRFQSNGGSNSPHDEGQS